jgi:thiamine-phosphate pyrophosphorylase
MLMSMFCNLTPAGTRAIEGAKRWAGRLGAAHVQPEHLLFALLEEDEGRAAQLLTGAGLDLAAFRYKHHQPAAEPVKGPERPAAPGAAVERVLDRARDLALESSADRSIATEQLLLALVLEEEAVCLLLKAEGVDIDRLVCSVSPQDNLPIDIEQPSDLRAPSEIIDAARILDASANRAREALRVIEDYCRFVLDDEFLTRQLKERRHELAAVLDELVPGSLEARETMRDVGTAVSTETELKRSSLAEVVQANCKRLQEAMRSLEEYSKLGGSEMARRIEKLRYDSYTLERVILMGARSRQRLAEVRLYVLLTGSHCARPLEWTIKEASAGGAQMFQLREKDLSDRELLERARQVRRWTRQGGALFVMNDRPDIGLLAEADGVHVGQEDLSVKEVRRILGADGLIGVSTHSLAQARQAILDGASYIGVGPVFPSETKEFSDHPGLGLVRQVSAETTLPIFAIGGIGPENVGQVVEAGAGRVAVSGAVCRAQGPREIAAALRRKLSQLTSATKSR